MSLQAGIYHGPGRQPPAAFTMLFLKADARASLDEVQATLADLWAVYAGLRDGQVRDLPGQPVSAGELEVLLGYGPKAFALGGRRRLPEGLTQSNWFESARPSGGGPLVAGGRLHYDHDVDRNPATEELCVQLTATTQLAVSRAVVETWKVLHDRIDPARGIAPLEITAIYPGFQREDGRSWVDFHDGVSNLRSHQRERVITIDPAEAPAERDRWTHGGTYLAFIRVAVDLQRWRGLSRTEQEVLVGRDKLTGAPLQRMEDGTPVPVPGCPVEGTRNITEPGNERFREPDSVDDAVLRDSHIHRANRTRSHPPELPGSVRVFRQGYEFLEPTAGHPGMRVGLNFVSFQDTPERLLRMLGQVDWLGPVNFGGSADRQPPGADRLLWVRAAGIYLVPPVIEGETFPGEAVIRP